MSEVCRILHVARSSVYYGRKRKGAAKIEQREIEDVKEVLEEHHYSFGRRTTQELLRQRGKYMTQYKISKILKHLGHRSKYGRRKGKNVNTAEGTREYRKENILSRLTNLQKEELVIWHMDFSEVKTRDGKLYLCGIISNGNRLLVGMTTSKHCNGKFAVESVRQAISRYGKPDIIHTDRGTQFVSKKFCEAMKAEGITQSMSRPHKPCDNAQIETFWKSMKVEIGPTDDYTDDEMDMIAKYYGYYYNTLRPHSALNYLSPLANMNLKFVI